MWAAVVQVVTPGVYITLPPDEDAEDDQAAGLPAATATPAAPAAGTSEPYVHCTQRLHASKLVGPDCHQIQ